MPNRKTFDIGQSCVIERATTVYINIGMTDLEVERHVVGEITNYTNLADKIQEKVYNSSHSAPSENCLEECNTFIDYNLDKRYFDVRFAEYEGQADTLRTSKHLIKELYNHPVYECLRRLAPHTSFPGIALMIYKFRYASALAVSGRVQKAKKVADKGMEKLQLFLNQTSMARVNASCLYGYVNVVLAGISQIPQTEQMDDIKEWIEKGLEQVKAIKDNGVANMWARMFLVKKACVLLKIGLSGEDISGQDISHEDRDAARKSLEEAEEHWTNTDERRLMLYKRAEAKLQRLAGDKEAALESLRHAITIAHHFKREEESYQLILQNWTA
ncbi:uncharacterized protein LOC117316590 [Pecten maximus]|uniref:uncharacterized protein LOC117316590 n=1 Tax=Pecten maximus TaxID=6579 RepID=UPI001458A345|nr:uncharacterized protein LOC117316590 [Pecten maximus]